MRTRHLLNVINQSLCTLSVLLATSHLAASAPLPVPERGFVSSQPAKIWEEGLICGNGTIGANALSRPTNERIIFTHERLFMPMGAPVMPPDQSARLFEIRQLIERGLYRQATELQYNLSRQSSFMYPDYFVPAFDLTIRSTNQGEVRDYRRSVDFQTGETAVRWSDDRGAFERRMFVSRADGVAVLAITSPKPGSLDCQLALEPREPSDQFNDDSDIAKRSDQMFKEHVGDIKSTASSSSLTYSNRYLKAYPGSIHALEGFARVIATGGTTEAGTNGTLTIKGADRVLIFVDLRPVYDPDKPEMKEMEASLAKLPGDYNQLLQRHAKLHGELFNRMRLDLGGGADHRRTTEELIAESTYEKPNRALIEKEFDAARYNIISCTGKLPPNLQGVWGGTYVPGWASDYTHNGNVPSAIAANLMGNLPELMLAYTTYIESIVPWLEINAKHLFGARGIVLPSRSSTHGFNNALAPNFAGGFWVGGAGWAAHFFYDYYLYTGDRKFLAEHALPFMEKATLFFEDYLYEGPDGKWVFSPTQSPENTPGNTKSQGTYNATMDVAVAKELLRNTIAASRELGRNQDKLACWQQMLDKMPDYMVDERGIIKEWLTPRLANNDSHRHSSQLYPLYDGNPDTFCDLLKTRARDPGSRHLRLDLGKATRLGHVLLEAPATGALRYATVAPTNQAEVSEDLKTWTPARLAQEGRNIRIECDPTQPFRYLRTDLVPDKLVEIRGFSEGKELDRGGWRASWLFPRFQKVCQAWSLPFSLEATAPGSYLTVACNGVHGREGAWVALRVDGRWVGAPQRAPSYPVNPWEYPVSQTDRNYSYFIPVTRDLLGKTCEVVVLAFDPKNLDFRPDVWLTAYPVPYQAKTLTLSE